MFRWALLASLFFPAAFAVAQPGRAPIPIPGSPGFRPGQPRPLRPTAPTPTGPVKLDAHGDPLPPGAVARLGTVRLRHGAEPGALGFSPDGKYLGSVSLTDDGIRLWDPATGKELTRLETPVVLAAFAKDGSMVITDESRCKVWSPFPGNAVRQLPDKTLPESTSAIAVHPDSRTLAAGSQQKIALIDLTTGRMKAELKVPGPQPPQKLAFSPDGRWLAGNGPKTGVWLWDLKTNKRLRTYPCQADQCDFAFALDGSRIAIAAELLWVYPTDGEEAEEGYTPPENPMTGPRFSADGKSIFAHLPDATIVRIETATGQTKDTWPPPGEANLKIPLAIAPDAAMVAAVDESGGIRIWNPKTGKGPEVDRLPILFEPGFSADGKTASCLDSSNKIRSFDPITGKPGKILELTVGEGQPVTWDAKTGRAAFAVEGEETQVHVVEAASGKVLAKITIANDETPPTIQFHPSDRDRLAIFSSGSVAVASISKARVLRTFAVGQGLVRGESLPGGVVAIGSSGGAISPDSRLAAVFTAPFSVWEVATGKKRFEFEDIANPLGAAFSPDGRTLAAWDNVQIALIDVRTGLTRRRIVLGTGEPASVVAQFAADGKRLATGSPDGTITIWDASTGNPLLHLERHDGAITGLAFSADGKTLISTANDGTALVWDLTVKAELKGAEAVTGAEEALRLLASADPGQAQRGIEFFHRNPAETVKLLGEKVVAALPTPEDRIAKLVDALGSDDFQTRQAAGRDLAAIGSEAGPALRIAVAKSTSPEVRKLAAGLLVKIGMPHS